METKRLMKRINFLNSYSKPFKEHWFIMIKPFTLDDIFQSILRLVTDYGLEVKEILTYNLSSSEANEGFGTKPKSYQEYLCSGSIRCIIVYGENAAQKCLVIKELIRLQYAVDYTNLKNYIHVPENGGEFHLQRKILFPDYECTAYSDLCVYWKQDILSDIYEMSGKLLWVGLVMKISEFAYFAEELMKYSNHKKTNIAILPAIEIDNNEIRSYTFISPWDLDEFHQTILNEGGDYNVDRIINSGGTSIIEIDKQLSEKDKYLEIDQLTCKNLYRGFKNIGPDLTLKCVEEHSRICFDRQLFEWGGSEDIKNIGQYITPQFKFYKFINMFKNI